MFSPEFNNVYDEAFHSIVGKPFDVPLYQQHHQLYSDRTVNALLEHWTSPNTAVDTAITGTFTTRRANLFHIKHPMTAEFGEDEAQDIAKVRFLGYKAIDGAIISLAMNEEHRGKKVELRFSQWHRAHPDNTIKPDVLAQDPAAPSPFRMLDWPLGDYVNCLGISIAAAAESETDPGVEYVYMNRIRHAQHEVNVNFAQISQRINKINSYAVYLEEIIHSARALREHMPPDLDRCAYGENAPAIITNMEIDNSFHHAVIRKKKGSEDILSNGWKQYDPYALVDADLSNHPLSNEAARRIPDMSDGTCNEILLYDSDVVDFSFKNIATTIDVALKLQDRLVGVLIDYKSTNYLQVIKKELLLQKNALFTAMLGHEHPEQLSIARCLDEGFRGTSFDDDFPYQWFMLLSTAAKHSSVLEGNSEIQRMLQYHTNAKLDQDIQQKVNRLETLVGSAMKTDSKLRNSLAAIVLTMPFAYCLSILEESAKLESLGGGTADQTMEICDPAFMIGSMYLNHYARWRKGDRVNVAKEIARISPSQLIWQAAVADDRDAARDPRVHAVGDLVKGLKLDQQHPLVRITAHPRRR